MSKESCIETIRVEDGQIFNMAWHNRRCNQTRREYYGAKECIDLAHFIGNPPSNGLFRCRVLYHQEILSVEYLPYQAKVFKTFKLIESDIEYGYKYSNRDALNQLKAQASAYDEIIIVKKKELTDTSIANIAFFDGQQWVTPKKPLLEGTMRAKLVEKGFLVEKVIKSDSFKHFSHFALINAMIGFEIQKKPTIYSEKEAICL